MGLLNKVFGKKKAYICYDDRDERMADDVCRALESKGFSCWLKNHDAGADRIRDIINAIHKSKLAVLIYSKNAVDSKSVSSEIDTAFSQKIPILVFRIDDTQLSDKLALFLNNQPWIDAFPNPNAKFEEMCSVAIKVLNNEFVPLGIRYTSLKNQDHGFEGGPPVHISYHTRDSEYAEAVCSALQSKGIGCWLDVNEIKTASNFAEMIVKAINDAKVQVVIFSEAAMDSTYVKNEVDTSFSSQKQIIALRIDDGTMPEGDMDVFLRAATWIDASPSALEKRNVTLHDVYEELAEEVNGILDAYESRSDEILDDEAGFEDDFVSGEETIPHVDEVPFPAYAGDEPYAFVSYAHKDYRFVFNEIKRFKKQGLNVWYDEGIAPGNEWLAEIGKALSGASLFIVFISGNSVASKFVRKEITYAINNDIPFIAIHIEKTEMPIQLDLALGDLQAILRYGMSDGEYYRRYTKAFNSHLDEYGIRLKSVDEI